MILPIKFRVNWHFDSGVEAHFRSQGFYNVAIFDLQTALILPTKFPVNWLFSSGDEGQNSFQDGCHGLAIFDLQVPNKFCVNLHFGSAEEAQHIFLRCPPWRHLVFPIATILDILIYKLPRYFLPRFESIAFRFRRRSTKWILKMAAMAAMAAIFDFRSERFSYFDVHATPILPAKFCVNWPRGVGGVVFWSKILTPHDGRRTLITIAHRALRAQVSEQLCNLRVYMH